MTQGGSGSRVADTGMQPTRAEWERALRLAQASDRVPAEAVDHALEALGGRPESELTPGLVAFWLDIPEAELGDLLALARTPDTVVTGPPGAAPPRVRPLPSTLGEFELTALLGQGGMGRVYRARQRSLARDVALKLLSPELLADSEGRRRFLREARVLAAASHPHVVTCYQAGEVEGAPFIAMELMAGGDVEGLAARTGGRLPERRALEVARDATAGLVGLEAAGLVHRDVKPKNLFLDAEGRVKLGDLGVARARTGDDRMTLTGVAVGTLPFMSPEQLEGRAEVDPRADVYSVGASLQVLLTGKSPRVGQGPPVDLVDRCPGLSTRTVALVRRAMSLDPARRFTPAQLLAALDEALAAPAGRAASDRAPRVAAAGKPRPAATNVALPPATLPPSRRAPTPLIALGAVAAAALAGVGLAKLAGPGRPQQVAGATDRATPTPSDASATPGADPSATPRADPSATPRADPSATPRADPSATPGADPSATPRADPSATPRADPSATPRADPSATPGADPSATPPSPLAADPPPASDPPDDTARRPVVDPGPRWGAREPEREPAPPPVAPAPSPPPLAPVEPATPPARPQPGGRGKPDFDVHPQNGTLARRPDGVWVSQPQGEWSRAALHDRAPRALPLHVRWTCVTEVSRDSSHLEDWERGHGFRETSGFFYELAARGEGRPIDAAAQLGPGAWWLTLQARKDGRVLGLVRVVNKRHPAGQQLLAEPPGGGPPSPGVAILDRFEARVTPGAQLLVDLRLDARGWELGVESRGQRLASSSGAWSASRAPITDELDGGAWLWTHLGNSSNGQGKGMVCVEVLD